MLKIDDGEPRWTVLDVDGHGVAAYDDSGTQLKLEVLGAYGQPLFEEGAFFALDSFHGQELQPDHQVVQMGVRHILHRDGMWLQPEPLLAFEVPNTGMPTFTGWRLCVRTTHTS